MFFFFYVTSKHVTYFSHLVRENVKIRFSGRPDILRRYCVRKHLELHLEKLQKNGENNTWLLSQKEKRRWLIAVHNDVSLDY